MSISFWFQLIIPRNYARKTSKASSYTKENLQSALEAIRNGTISIQRASLLYKSPRSTLCDHNKRRRGMRSTSLGRTTGISLAQEQRIADTIRAMEKWGFGLSRREVLEKVGAFVKANGLTNSISGADNGYQYFDLLKTTFLELDILEQPEHIWNLDETSFCADPSKTKVVGGVGIPSTRTTSGPGRDNTTVLCACRTAGEKAIPFFRGRMCTMNGLLRNKSGWMETPGFLKLFKKKWSNNLETVD